MVWDPYERMRREQIRRARAEQARRAQEAARRPQGDLPLEVVQRLQEALQRSRQEQEALVQRYEQQLEAERNRRAVLRQEFQQLQERQMAQFRQQLQEERRQQQALQRALEEAEQRALQPQDAPAPPQQGASLIERFQQELAEARRERDEWADRYDQALASLSEERERLEAERAELQAARASTQAEAREEAEQQRQRIQRNAEQRAFSENRETLLRLIEVADNLERALQQSGDNNHGIEEGVRLTLRDFRRALERSGVERIPSEGEVFDPTQHEAISSAPSDLEPGRVLTEVLPGYLYRGVLLRPAKVIISA